LSTYSTIALTDVRLGSSSSIDKFDASGCSELNLEMNGVCLGLKKTMHEAKCDVPVKKDIVRISSNQWCFNFFNMLI